MKHLDRFLVGLLIILAIASGILILYFFISFLVWAGKPACYIIAGIIIAYVLGAMLDDN